MSEERLRILKMIDEGKISVDEGSQLLVALRGDASRAAHGGEDERRWFRLRVTDVNSGETKVSVNVPIKLVLVGAKMGARFVPRVEGVDVEAIMTRIREGEEGVMLNLVSGDERFEIFVE